MRPSKKLEAGVARQAESAGRAARRPRSASLDRDVTAGDPSGRRQPLYSPMRQTVAHSSSVTGCTERRDSVTNAILARAGSAFTATRETGFGKGATALKSTSTQGSPGVAGSG